MRYSKARPEIQSGDILLWAGSGPGGALVRWWTRSEWGHIGIAWVVGGRVLSLDANPKHGVRVLPLRKRLPAEWMPLGGVWNDEAERLALETLGSPYGWLDAIRAGLGAVVHRDGAFQCAEFVQYVHGATGLLEKRDSPTPETIYTQLEAQGRERVALR